jgi:hypothetical protein
MFGQQKDEHRAWVPNTDLIFSEAETRSEIKMLPEMRTQEMGSMIVSTLVLPRGQDRRPDSRVQTSLFPLHWPGQMVDAAVLCVR